jgi:hypothetical protein
MTASLATTATTTSDAGVTIAAAFDQVAQPLADLGDIFGELLAMIGGEPVDLATDAHFAQLVAYDQAVAAVTAARIELAATVRRCGYGRRAAAAGHQLAAALRHLDATPHPGAHPAV